jgi:hypothetical protein
VLSSTFSSLLTGEVVLTVTVPINPSFRGIEPDAVEIVLSSVPVENRILGRLLDELSRPFFVER